MHVIPVFFLANKQIGPNAASQDDLYQQLMTNNATWTVIDRGESDSYFAIWDLVDYMGLGGTFQEQCKLLREVWEETALSNDLNDSELLRLVMKDYDRKKRMFLFVQSLIYSLVPANGNFVFDASLADQFAEVVKAAVNLQYSSMRSDTPLDFIDAGFNHLSINDIDRKFELVMDNEGYDVANEILLDTKIEDWRNSFTYYTDAYTMAILEKGSVSHLLEMCKRCKQSNENLSEWKYVSKLLMKPEGFDNHDDTLKEKFTRHLARSARFADVENGWRPLHYSLYSLDKTIIRDIYYAYPDAAYAKIDENTEGGFKEIFDLVEEPLFKPLGMRDFLKKDLMLIPAYNFDFTDSDIKDRVSFTGSVAVEEAPSGFPGQILRLGKKGSAEAELINPNRSDLTLVVGVRLNSIVPDSNGFLAGFTKEQSVVPDLGIVMHSTHFPNGLGLVTSDGRSEPFWNLPDEIPVTPQIGDWVQLAAVFTRDEGIYLYVNGMKSPTLNGSDQARELYDKLLIGESNHPCNCSVNQIMVYDRKLDDSAVQSLWSSFYYDKKNSSRVPAELPPFPATIREWLGLDSIPILTNVALRKNVFSLPMTTNAPAQNAVDGDPESYGHIAEWFIVKLGKNYNIRSITIHTRSLLSAFTVEASSKESIVWSTNHPGQGKGEYETSFTLSKILADEVKISLATPGIMTIKEFEVYAQIPVTRGFEPEGMNPRGI